MDSFKKFSEDKLPNICKFFSSLKDKCINKKEYLHVIDVWYMLEKEHIIMVIIMAFT